jgi:hypothetical protein
MRDMQAQEFTRIASRATDAAKQELFTRLAKHFLVLASGTLRLR